MVFFWMVIDMASESFEFCVFKFQSPVATTFSETPKSQVKALIGSARAQYFPQNKKLKQKLNNMEAL